MTIFSQYENVILIHDTTGADNRPILEQDAAEDMYPGMIVSNGALSKAALAVDKTEAQAIVDLKVYTDPTLGSGRADMQLIATGEKARLIYLLNGDVVRIKKGSDAFAMGDLIGVANGLATAAADYASSIGRATRNSAASDSHVSVRYWRV